MEKSKSSVIIAALYIIMSLIMCHPMATAGAQDRCTKWVAKMESKKGIVQVLREGDTEWVSVELNETYCPGDSIRTLEKSRATLRLPNEVISNIDQKTTFTFNGIEKDSTSLLDLIIGAFHFFSRAPRALKVTTPFVNGTVEGTEFFVRVTPDYTLISVFQGNVLAANNAGNLNLTSGQSAMARAGEAPKAHIVARPRDAVQWAIYYPAVIDYRPTDFPGEEAWQGMVRISIRHYRDGDLAAAFSSLEGVPETIPDPRFYTYRAGLLLTVGQVDEASDDIEKSLAKDPANSHAFALRSIIAVAQNRKEEAQEQASRAVSLDPDSSAARVALSYAYQASFQIQAALKTLQEAVVLSPENALAWARLSELWMSMGDLDKALEAARKGANLNPSLAHTQTVLGFAYLAQIKIQDAREAFEKAIALDHSAPLPRLGLGLAKIRKGDLESGRSDIEMAVCLDPDNSLLRSYLGKAFFDEKRDKHSDRQFALAKELDPNDPTPWLYDAIRKQTLNRPVEALRDLQKSIKLNDNRAVYRSRLGLDEDLATRSASLGRIYSDLGFQQLALVEGLKSVNTDPSNYSAHRFLADSYSALPRHEIARVSELLQSQLLQPINITPVQPSLAESDLLILEGAGPTDPAFNEFNPLFYRNRFAFQASGVAGGENTLGGEVVQSGVWGRASYSIGAFHYETDGFRENNDTDQRVYNVFTQANPWYHTSIFTEYRATESEFGDLPLRFDPELFYPDDRNQEKTKSIRLGVRHSFSPKSDLIATAVYKDIETKIEILPSQFVAESEDDGHMAEIQHLFRLGSVSFISGLGYFRSERKDTMTFSTWPPLIFEDAIEHTNLYIYSQINIPKDITWTLGASADWYKGILDKERFNPKVGITWNLTPSITLRAAATKVLNRSMISNQTIEPTQVAGFNQFFDDIEAVEAWRYGAAIDQILGENLFCGLELSKRDLDTPYQGPTFEVAEAKWHEENIRAYLYWTPRNWLTVNAEYEWERFERDLEMTGREQIHELETHKLPMSANLYFPFGISARLKATYVGQKGEFDPFQGSFATQEGNDYFWVLDLSISYRLSHRHGVISLEAKNMLDEQFRFQTMEKSYPEIVPDRFIIARITLSF